ncbi:MAG: hypothetical protein KF744_08115 [Taibaiella sp.]|nr:hypothetical protein [Taibaiella sp.]
MKTQIQLLILLILVLTSCNNGAATNTEASTPDFNSELRPMTDYLRKFEDPPQIFEVSPAKPQKLIGNQGTTIYVVPDDLVTEDGEAVKASISMELKELTNQNQLLKNSAPTVSNGKMLISGGAYFLNLKSGGKQLKLKEGRSMAVEFPRLTNMSMSLFYGNRDSLGTLNWAPTQQEFTSKPTKQKADKIDRDKAVSDIDAIMEYADSDDGQPLNKEQLEAMELEVRNVSIERELYQRVELKQFGWINCDRFLEVSNKTNLKYSFRDVDSVRSVTIYLVFKDINSLMQNFYFTMNPSGTYPGFENIPVGADVRLIAFMVKNERIFASKTDSKIKPGQTIQIQFTESTDEQFSDMFNLN